MKAMLLLALTGAVACNDTPATTAPAAAPVHPGRVVFQQQCALCHSIDGSKSQGPSLLGVVGRPAATFAGFNYTKAMKQSGLTWDVATLNAFLANPMAAVPGSLMVQAVADPAQRATLIEYLATLKAP